MTAIKELCETCGTLTLKFDPPIEVDADDGDEMLALAMARLETSEAKVRRVEEVLGQAIAVGAPFLIAEDIKQALK